MPTQIINGTAYEQDLARRIQMRAEYQRRQAAEAARVASLTPEQLAAEKAARAEVVAKQQAQMDEWAAWKKEYAKTSVPMYSVQGPEPLTERGKVLQRVILANDLDTLFNLLPRNLWDKRWHLGKYAFKEQNGQRQYIPMTEDQLREWVFSPYLNVAPGWDCTDERKEAIVAAHWKKIQGHAARYPSSDWKHVWPIYPNGAYPGQYYNCQEYRGSTWVRVRAKVYIAVAIVVAVYLGPVILEKVGGMLANMGIGGGGAGGAAGGAAGGGAGGAAGTAATATKTSAFISKVNSAVNVYNKVNTVAHIVQGKIPPPPVGISGATFKAVAVNLVKQEIKKAAINEAMEQGIKYVQKKMTAKEEAAIRAEIEMLQKKMEALVPKDTPIMPSPLLPEKDRIKIAEIQAIQADREKTNNTLIGLGLGAGLLFLTAGA